MKNRYMISIGTVLASLGGTACVLAQEASAEVKPVIYNNVALIDGVGDNIRPNMSIIVVDEIISAVLPMSELTNEQTNGADIVDGGGWYALPGLVESHTHLATEPNRQFAEFILNRQLYSGITIARDLAGDARALMDLSRAALIKEIPAPDLKYIALMSGPDFFSDERTVSSSLGAISGEVSWMQAVTETTDMKQAVAYAKGTWATAIKTYSDIDGKTIKLIADEANKQGILVWSHAEIGPASAIEVASADVSSMSHIDRICESAVSVSDQEKADRGEISGVVKFDKDSPVIDAVFAEMKKNNIILDATLYVMHKQDSDVVGNIIYAVMDAFDRFTMSKEEKAEQYVRPGIYAKCKVKDVFYVTQRAHEAGVRLSTGTDGWSKKESPFPALYDEFRLMHEKAGIPMMDVIKAATINGAHSVGMEDIAGTISEGKLANLVFLKQNPLDGVDSFETVVLTVKRGTPYYRKDFVLGSPGEVSLISN